MNLILILANVIGFSALAAATLKVLEKGPTIGPPFSPAARVVLLALVFLAVYSTIEVLSWGGPLRPGGSLMIFCWGCFACWRVFSPAWVSFFSRPAIFFHRGPPPPPVGTLQL